MEPRVEVMRDERNNPVSETPLPVDWAAVLAKAEELRGDGRDLRLLVIVARALANERGLAGLADGLTLVARTLEAHWDTLHPELRPAATARATRRCGGSTPSCRLQNDEDGLLGDLRRAVFFDAARPRAGDRPRPRARHARRAHGARRAATGIERGDAGRARPPSTRRWSLGSAARLRRACRPGAGEQRAALTEAARAAARRRRGGRGARWRRGSAAEILPARPQAVPRPGARDARPRPRRAATTTAEAATAGIVAAGPIPGAAPAPVAAAIMAPSRDDSPRARRSSPASTGSSSSTTGPSRRARCPSSHGGCAGWCRWTSSS